MVFNCSLDDAGRDGWSVHSVDVVSLRPLRLKRSSVRRYSAVFSARLVEGPGERNPAFIVRYRWVGGELRQLVTDGVSFSLCDELGPGSDFWRVMTMSSANFPCPGRGFIEDAVGGCCG